MDPDPSLGQEIDTISFEARDFERYGERLRRETEHLHRLAEAGKLSERGPVAGFELEAWLIDERLQPAPVNQGFMQAMADPLVTCELALFNVELNNHPRRITGDALQALERELIATWSRAVDAARSQQASILTIGTLPTLRPEHLSLEHMSPLKRYRALNQQVLRARAGRPLRLEIVGREHLTSAHDNVMLESATTSFQIHLQVPYSQAHRVYNAAIAVSAATVAVGANAPFLFHHDLWSETRVPLFEQAVELGGFNDAAHGPLQRASFGSHYASESILECFEENLQHFPVLLPMCFDDGPEQLSHLRLHNGTIWRWNRPLIGFDDDGTPHVRIEHRVLPGSPSMLDALANAALFYGLVRGLCDEVEGLEQRLPFPQAKDNFYQAARYGLEAQTTWLDARTLRLQTLLLEELVPLARRGLHALGVEAGDRERYLGVIERRVDSAQNGADWQRRFAAAHGPDPVALTSAYLDNQMSGAPVHTWPL